MRFGAWIPPRPASRRSLTICEPVLGGPIVETGSCSARCPQRSQLRIRRRPLHRPFLMGAPSRHYAQVIVKTEPVATCWIPQAEAHVGTVSEKELMTTVCTMAQLHGWLVYHTYDSRRSTPGFPDLCLLRPSRCILAELKSQGARHRRPKNAGSTPCALSPPRPPPTAAPIPPSRSTSGAPPTLTPSPRSWPNCVPVPILEPRDVPSAT